MTSAITLRTEMLDPRIYRTGMTFVLLAAILVAFSLGGQQAPATTTDVPDAFSGATAYATMQSLATGIPVRTAGSEGDDALASSVARTLTGYGFQVSEPTAGVQTPSGSRTVVNVIATRAGQLPASILVLAPRDDAATPAVGGLSGTAVLLELARVLSGGTQRHNIVLASISGSAGSAGAERLAESLPGPLDAVISLGDLDAAQPRGPVVLPYSDGVGFAPTRLRNTVAAALAGQGSPHPTQVDLGLQLAHLALPVATTPEAPFNARGVPAVTVSLRAGSDGGAQEALAGAGELGAMGRGVLSALDAVDGDTSSAAPAAYLVIKGKVLPDWALRLLVLAALLPVVAVALDGAARASRRGFPLLRWLLAVVARALPVAVAVAAVVLARAIGLLHAPPGLVGPGELSSPSDEVLVLVLALLLAGGLLAAVRLVVPLPLPRARRSAEPPAEQRRGWRNPGAAAAVLLVLCAVELVVWVQNPYAAALLVPALHLWMWNMDPDLALPVGVRALLFACGFVPPVLVVYALAHEAGLGPSGVLWSGMLLIAGGGIKFVTLLEWCALASGSVAAGACVVGRGTVSAANPQSSGSVRGPSGYAGPGSLGGTESALRR